MWLKEIMLIIITIIFPQKQFSVISGSTKMCIKDAPVWHYKCKLDVEYGDFLCFGADFTH